MSRFLRRTLRARRMAEALAHRGPDGEGAFSHGPCALAHRRLSIIDLAGGAQPMRSADGLLAVAFNGEIYNYKELRKELGEERFRTASDTECLLHLYEDQGERMLGRLRGMFAFALWDARRGRLLLARDRFGEKPLFYARRPGQLAFASELPALKAGAADFFGPVSRRALSRYLTYLYVPGAETAYEGVWKLPAGHFALFDEKGLTVAAYHRPAAPGAGRALWRGARRERLAEAVRLQLRSDVLIAALLSGGLDSSAVVALMARELGPGVRTYAVGFGRADDELPHARVEVPYRPPRDPAHERRRRADRAGAGGVRRALRRQLGGAHGRGVLS
jgi:asparagine synthase (glutamine-hydrolysing)